jgi:putative flippase GtrA
MSLQLWKRLATFVTIGGLGFGVEAVVIILATSEFGFSGPLVVPCGI